MLTDIHRLFDVSTRSLKCIKGSRTSAGQVFDSCTAVLHFEYSDPTFLEPSVSGEEYKPYIIFDVRDENGTVLAYGPNSTPAFDGYTFPIPWDVTTRVKGDRVRYQLCFSKNTYAVDERGVVQIIRDTQNILSARDSLVIKESIRCDPRAGPGCRPPVPFAEPNIAGIIQMFKDYGVVVPVSYFIDESENRLCLRFRTYSGLNDFTLPLEVPYLDEDGKVSSDFYRVISDWSEATDENLASALLVRMALEGKIDKKSIVTAWSDSLKDTNVPSEKLVKTSLDGKLDRTQLVTEWSETLSDTNIPSEKLVKDMLDVKTDFTLAIRPWENDVEYPKDATVIYDGTIYISLNDGNLNNDPSMDEMNWSRIQGAEGGADDGVFTTMVGDGVNTEYTIQHNLGTLNYFVQLRRNDSTRMFVNAKVSAINMNEVKVEFTNPPMENGIILMLVPGDRTRSVYCETIGNGADSEYIVTHNLGMYNFFCELRKNNADREYVSATVSAISPTQARIVFEYPVATDGITVMIAPAIPTGWEGRWIHAQLDPSTEWVVDHDLTRMVSVQTYSSEGYLIYGTVKQDMDMLDTVTIRFSQPVSGYAVLQ